MRRNLLRPFATYEKLMLLKEMLFSLRDPDKILEEINYDYEELRSILYDPHVNAAITQRKMQVKQMGWELSNIKDEEYKDELLNLIAGLNMQSIIHQVLEAVLYGYQVLEVNWKYVNGKYIPTGLSAKPQEWFIFNNKGEVSLRKFVNGTYIYEEGEKLPKYKFITIVNNPTYYKPQGEKALTRAYNMVQLKKVALEFWQIMTERFGIPYLIGRYAPGTPQNDIDKLLDEVNQMAEDLITVLPTDATIEIMENPKYEIGQLYEKLCDFANKEISKAILTVTLTLETEKSGSYKIAEVHKEMLNYVGTSDKKLVEFALNEILRYYKEVNYGNEIKERATVKLKKKENVIEESVERDEKLVRMGVKFKKEYFMKRYNLRENEFELRNGELRIENDK